MTFRQKVIGDCCDGLTASCDIYCYTQNKYLPLENLRWSVVSRMFDLYKIKIWDCNLQLIFKGNFVSRLFIFTRSGSMVFILKISPYISTHILTNTNWRSDYISRMCLGLAGPSWLIGWLFGWYSFVYC